MPTGFALGNNPLSPSVTTEFFPKAIFCKKRSLFELDSRTEFMYSFIADILGCAQCLRNVISNFDSRHRQCLHIAFSDVRVVSNN